MKNLLAPFLCIFTCLTAQVLSQEPDKTDLQKGVNYIQTKVYSDEDNARILKLFDGLRVADVTDGMDMVGLPDTGLVDPAIHADWIDSKDLSHQFRGIAVTARYVPSQRPDRPAPGEDFKKWEADSYTQYSHEAFTKLIKPGTAIVIDDVQDKDIGSIGSNNILAWHKLGAVGVVTDAAQEIPTKYPSKKCLYIYAKKAVAYAPAAMNWNRSIVPCRLAAYWFAPAM